MTKTPAAPHSSADDFFQGEHLPEEPNQPPRTEEQDLWFSVITNAINDAFFASDYWLGIGEKYADPDLIRGDARRFLTMTWGEWAASRERVCQAAGVDPDLLARVCRKRLALWKSETKGEPETAEIVTLDSMFAKLIDCEKIMDPAQFNLALADLAALENKAA